MRGGLAIERATVGKGKGGGGIHHGAGAPSRLMLPIVRGAV